MQFAKSVKIVWCQVLALGLTFFFSSEISAGGKSIVSCHPELCKTEESLARENAIADRFNLPRVKNDASLRKLVREKHLVPVPTASKTFFYRGYLKFRFTLPATRKFLEDFSERHYLFFRRPLKVTELVRTENYQRQLVRAGLTVADGKLSERRSTHLTGATLDISKQNLTEEQIDWIRQELIRLREAGVVEAIEEKNNNTFHIFVVPLQ